MMITVTELMNEWIKLLRTLPACMLLYSCLCHWSSQITVNHTSGSIGPGLDGLTGATRDIGDRGGVGARRNDSGWRAGSSATWPRFSGIGGGANEVKGVGGGNDVISYIIGRGHGSGISESIGKARILREISADDSFRGVDREIHGDANSFGSTVGGSTVDAGGTGGDIIRPRYSDTGKEVDGDNEGKANRTARPYSRIAVTTVRPNSTQDSMETRMPQSKNSKPTAQPPGSELKEALLWLILPLALVFLMVIVYTTSLGYDHHCAKKESEQRANCHGPGGTTTNSAGSLSGSLASRLDDSFQNCLFNPAGVDSTAAPTSTPVQTWTLTGESDNPARRPGGSQAIRRPNENHSTVEGSSSRGSDEFTVAANVISTPVIVDETIPRIRNMSPADSVTYNFNTDLPPSYEDAMETSDSTRPPPYKCSLVSPDFRNTAQYQTYPEAPSSG